MKFKNWLGEAARLALIALVIAGVMPAMGTVYKWSTTASSNSTADSSINWAEGMAPSAVNDSARAMMAALAKYRDDMAGTITTSGTGVAYTATSNQVFSSLAAMDGKVVCFVPHATSDTPATLNVDSLGDKPLRASPGVDLSSGALVAGTPYCATYDNDEGEWIVAYVNANTTVPLGTILDYTGSSAPSSNYVLPYGQAVSRTTYARLFALIGTTYGSGDGATTFNLPDLRGRVVAGDGDMGGSSSGRLTSSFFGGQGNTLGATGGSESHTLTTAQLPTVTPSGTVSTPAIVVNDAKFGTAGVQFGGGVTAVTLGSSTVGITAASTQPTFTGNSFGSGNAHNNVQPTIVLNKIMRVL